MIDRKLAIFSRRTLILGAVAAALIGNQSPKRPPRVLFVCEHGTVKSPIARELMRRRAAERGLAVWVRSRGVAPEEGGTPELAAALAADRIDPKREPLQKLRKSDFGWADIIVHFHPVPFNASGKKLRDWGATPSPNRHYDESMASLTRAIDALLDELAGSAA
jgi:protein-tyrosine-phosphatase